MACLLHLVLFVFKSRTLTLCIAHFSEYCDSYTGMLVNSSLLRCHDTYLSDELYRASEFLFHHYVKRFLDFLLLFCFLQSMAEVNEMSSVQGRF